MGQDLSLLRRLFGHNPNSIPESEWPQLAQEWAGREIEMPTETGQVNRIAPMNWLQKLMNPDAYASTGLMGNINLNKELIDKDKQNLGDVLVHELAHVGQGESGFLRKFYESNKVEDEAVNREAFRPVRKGDIHLPSPPPYPMDFIGPTEDDLRFGGIMKKSKPLWSDKELSPALVAEREYWRKKEQKKGKK